MDKDLDFNGGIGADIADLLPAQLPAEHHPLQAHGGAKLDTGQGVNGHLGGAVNRNLGGNLAAKLHHPQILDDKGIDIVLGGMADQLRHLLHLPVCHQGVDSQVYLHTPDMAVFDCLHQGLGGKVLCALAGVKAAAAQVNRIGSVLHRCPKGLHGARRCQ